MKPRYEENIEIIPKIDGTLLVSLTWRDHSFQEELPRAADRWPEKEFRRYLKDIVIPRLRLQLLKVQKEALETGTAPVEACLPAAELDQNDLDAMNRAESKRERKAAKLKALN